MYCQMSKVFTDNVQHSQYPGEKPSPKSISVSNAIKQTVPKLQTKIQSLI
jgi:hypothetical protein